MKRNYKTILKFCHLKHNHLAFIASLGIFLPHFSPLWFMLFYKQKANIATTGYGINRLALF